MRDKRRYHPLIIGYELMQLIKSLLVPFIFFFLTPTDPNALYVRIGQILTIAFTIGYIIYIILKWMRSTYRLDEEAFYLSTGVFIRSDQTIPITKIQNTQHKHTLFHKIFGVTSVKFDTGMTGNDASITFPIVALKELQDMEAHIEHVLRQKQSELSTNIKEYEPAADATRKLHFQSTHKDIFKAAFSSLSFFIVIPVSLSIYLKLDDLFKLKDTPGALLLKGFHSWTSGILTVGLLIIFSFIVGLIVTYIRYGNYEIYSDEEFIYIKKGVLVENSFSIVKARIQAIEIRQSLIKQWFRIAEVRLVSAGIQADEAEKLDVNSLYPFLPYQRAVEMIEEILPTYQLTNQVKKLPRVAIFRRILTPSIVILSSFALIMLNYPNGTLIPYSMAILIGLYLFYIIIQIIDVLNTRYAVNHTFFQVKQGVLITSLFISSRKKIITVKMQRSLFQSPFHLYTFKTTNRSNPVRQTTLRDIPLQEKNNLQAWYFSRRDDIEIQ